MATADQLKATVREYFERTWGEGDLSVIDEQFAADYVGHVPLQPEAIGTEGYKTMVRTYRTAFPDVEASIEDLVVDGDTVAVRYTWQGTHEGELMGIDPTGQTVEGTGMAVFRFEEGQRTEDWILDDTFGLLQQLGVIELPSESMPTERTGLQKRLDEVGSVLASGDVERIGNLYTPECQLMPPGREFVTGREAAAEFWQGVGDMGVETIDIETVEIEAHETTARRVGRATLADADGATIDQVKFIEIWNREDGAWRIHRDIWNSSISEGQ